MHDHDQVLLLEYLYGLLDEADAAKVRELVSNDPAWRSAFADAQQAQELFGKAAQLDRPVPLFTVPGEQTPAIPSQQENITAQSLPMTLPVRPRRVWGRWVGVVLAASVVIGACGLAVAYQRGAHGYETQLSQADVELKAIDNRLAQLQVEQKAEAANIPERVAGRFKHLNVSGPATYYADAPLPIRVRTTDVRGAAKGGQVSVTLLADNKELARRDIKSPGETVVELPPGLEVAASKNLVVETNDGLAKATETIAVGKSDSTTHLAVNKSNLKTGEILFFRTLTLDRFSMKPPAESVDLSFALVDAKGKIVGLAQGNTGAGGIGGGEFAVDKAWETGGYALRVTDANGTQLAVRPLEVSRPETPQLQRDRSIYRAGQEVNVDAIAPGYKKLSVNVTGDDGTRLAPNLASPGGAVPLDRDGKAQLQFYLPRDMSFNAVKMEADFFKEGQKKQVQQILPVIGSKLEVNFFPESGKLLAGTPNRVYYRVQTPLGEPVAPEGHVILLSSKDVVFDSEREQGIGVFSFTPDPKEAYTLRVTSPQGTTEVKDPFASLVVEGTGIALSADNSVAKEGEPIAIAIQNMGLDRRLLLVAMCRDRVVAERFVDVPHGNTKVSVAPVSSTRGAVRVTLYATEADHLQRLAERLVYRIPEQRLQVAAESDKKSYEPGERVRLKVTMQDETGKLGAGYSGIVVVDENELGSADRLAAGLESYFYLFAELGPPLGVEQTLLNFADGAETRQALDLYLGTRNWRATAAEEKGGYASADKKGGGEAPLVFSNENADRPQRAAELAEQELATRIARQRSELDEERSVAALTYERAAAVLTEFRSLPGKYASLAAGILAMLSLAAGSVLLVVGLVRILMQRSGSPAFVGACACMFVCLVLFGVSATFPPTEIMVAKAPAAPEWVEHQRELFALAEAPKLPVGKFAPPQKTPAPTVPLASMARNLDANRAGYEYLDVLAYARGERRGTANGLGPVPALESVREKENKASQSEELQKRFIDNLSAQRAGAGGMAPTTQPQANPLAKTAAAKDAEKKADRQNAKANGYVHQLLRSTAAPDIQDLQDTVLWKPLLELPQGEADISFDLSQRPTNYRVIIFGNDAAGRLGFNQDKLIVRPKE